MNSISTTCDEPALGGQANARDRALALIAFGHVSTFVSDPEQQHHLRRRRTRDLRRLHDLRLQLLAQQHTPTPLSRSRLQSSSTSSTSFC
jgi:hypothetical protein